LNNWLLPCSQEYSLRIAAMLFALYGMLLRAPDLLSML
jgi:hypothetical protein